MSTILKAGKYYVGDLCYAIKENWIKLLKDTDYFRDEESLFYKDQEFFAADTFYGDGEYRDNKDRAYYVDSGTIGIMPYEIIDKESEDLNGGQIIEFKEDFEVSEEQGYFTFGDIKIDTTCFDENEDYEE